MGVDKEVFDKIRELSLQAAGEEPRVERDGLLYSPVELHPVLSPREPLASPLQLHTLQAFCDYLTAGPDSLDLEKLAVHVVTPMRVHVVGPVAGYHRQREVLAAAVTPECPAVFDRPLTLFEAVTMLQVAFVDGGHRNKLIGLLSSVSDGTVKTATDDGISQTVEVRQGVQLVGEAVVPNPVSLYPYRTFRELSQPGGKFIVRMVPSEPLPKVILMSVPDGSWELEAVACIKEWLADHLGRSQITILA